MTALTESARTEEDASLRPVPWRRMAWVTWRQHRFALTGVAALLGAVAAYLWHAGLQVHHAYAAVTACHPATSNACGDMTSNFMNKYDHTATLIPALLQAVPALIGAFVGAAVLARELETGTFRYAWTQGFGRWRWTLAKLMPLAIVLAAAAAAFSQLFSWYYRPFIADGQYSPLATFVFDLRGIAFAAWTLAAFAIGALVGMLIRRVVPAIVATLAAYTGLALGAGMFLRQHYMTPLTAKNMFDPPASALIVSQWWTKAGTTVNQSRINQLINSMFYRLIPAAHGADGRAKKYNANLNVMHHLTQHGYTQWTTYQPASRFWPFQSIEAGWLLALSALLIAGTVWLVDRRAA